MDRALSATRTLILLVMALGCGSQIFPKVVVEGTTATIAIPADFDVGFGRRVAGNPSLLGTGSEPTFDPNSPLEDLQRGEMILRLLDPSASHGEIARLPVRWVTRVALDESSTEALDDANLQTRGQVVAFVDIPPNLVSDAQGQRALEVKVQRYRRDPANGMQFAAVQQSWFESRGFPGQDWRGWGYSNGGSPDQYVPISVRDASGTDGPQEITNYTPLEAWGPFISCIFSLCYPIVADGAVTALLQDTVPNTEFHVVIPSSQAPPAAWELEVQYPASRLSVRGVRLIRENPSGAIVTWSAPTPPVPACGTGGPATVKIQVVDPEAAARGVAVVFKAENLGTEACQARILEEDLLIVTGSIKAYDANGTAISVPSSFFTVGGPDLI